MAGGTNQYLPKGGYAGNFGMGGRDRRTGAPPGFTHGGGASTRALVDYINPTTKPKWTASGGGWDAPEGWEVDQGATWDDQGNQLTQKTGHDYTDWKDPYGEAQDTRLGMGGGGWGGYPNLGGLFGGGRFSGDMRGGGLFGSREQPASLMKYQTIYN